MNDAQHHLPVGTVLAGGLSARLGTDKAALTLAAPGPAGSAISSASVDILTRTALLLRKVLPRVLVSGRVVEGFEHCPDRRPGLGPVAGIASALAHTGESCLVLSCDLPFMRADLLERLIREWNERPEGAIMTAFCHEDVTTPETLAAIYDPQCLPLMEDHLDQKLVKVSRVIPPERCRYVTYTQAEALAFFNLNYPADLEAARIIATCRSDLL